MRRRCVTLGLGALEDVHRCHSEREISLALCRLFERRNAIGTLTKTNVMSTADSPRTVLAGESKLCGPRIRQLQPAFFSCMSHRMESLSRHLSLCFNCAKTVTSINLSLVFGSQLKPVQSIVVGYGLCTRSSVTVIASLSAFCSALFRLQHGCIQVEPFANILQSLCRPFAVLVRVGSKVVDFTTKFGDNLLSETSL